MVRGDKLIARTRDHSYSELQETMSHMVPMPERFNRNVLFTCLGSPGKPVIDTAGPLVVHAGDRVMLCSDGLPDYVREAAAQAAAQALRRLRQPRPARRQAPDLGAPARGRGVRRRARRSRQTCHRAGHHPAPSHRASGPTHGSCRRDRFRRQGRCRKQDRRDGVRWN